MAVTSEAMKLAYLDIPIIRGLNFLTAIRVSGQSAQRIPKA